MSSTEQPDRNATVRSKPWGMVAGGVLLFAIVAAVVWWMQSSAANAAEQAAKAALEQQGVILVPNGAHIEVLSSMQPIDDALFVKIGDLSYLSTCNLAGAQVTDSQMTVVGGLSKLLNLHIDGSSKLTSAGLSPISGMGGLEKLFASRTGIDDAGLVHLKRLTNLNTIDLSYTKITDQGLQTLTALPNLQVLRVTGTDVTDAGVESLKAMPGLSSVNIANTKITAQGAAALRSSRPGLIVEEMEDVAR